MLNILKLPEIIKDKIALLYEIHFREKFFINPQALKFYRVFGGHIYFQVLHAAIKFNLFTLLKNKGPLTQEEITKELGIELQPCRIMLMVLVVTEILEKNGLYYKNSSISQMVFDRNSPDFLGAYIDLQNLVYYKGMPYFYDSVKSYSNCGIVAFKGEGKTLYERLEHDKPVQEVFQKAMQELSIASNKYLIRFLDLSDTKYLVDVGGGNATNIISFAKKFPNLKASVFDFPGVTELAKKNIAEHGLSDRLNALPGNCFTDEFPKGADCVLFCHFFTMWSKEEDLGLLKKAFSALPEGGKAVIFNMMQHNDETGPYSAAVGSPYFLAIASGRGMLYTWNEYIEMFKTAGFKKIKTVRLPKDHGFIWGVK